ncbi:MAG: hypothetical protein KAS32_31450 [Candidatus Peribacteraceae bacterium]|nr:hypothetical protein [Candidatus Peribacteraceae bacterium]
MKEKKESETLNHNIIFIIMICGLGFGLTSYDWFEVKQLIGVIFLTIIFFVMPIAVIILYYTRQNNR